MSEYPKHWVNETTLPQNKRLMIDKDMIRSKAYCKLTGAAKHILLELYCRITVECQQYRRSKDKKIFAQNNGKIKLSYTQMNKMFGFSTDTISKAIDRLVKCGFIEIVKLGIGAKKQSHEIALIKNWRDYGTERFWAGKGKANKPLHGGFKKKIPSKTGVQ